MKRLWNTTDYILLALVVVISTALFLHNLSNPYITLWDEAVHANVVKNLANDCCTPKLHLQDYGTDYRNWTDNYIWLHKPPTPLLVTAGFFSILGKTLWAFRFPNVFFIEIAIILMFAIGKRFFGWVPAIISTSLFAFNHYTFELVQGRQFSGISDILLIVWLLCSLYCIFLIGEKLEKKYFIWFGLFEGLAFLCKDGLALLPFLMVGVMLLKDIFVKRSDIKRIAGFYLYAVLVALLFVATEKIYLVNRFPTQYTYESEVQLAHIFTSVEYWGRPWYFYFKEYWKTLFGSLAGALVYVSLAYSIVAKRVDKKFFVLSLWMLSYLFVLSLMVSKISNFLYPVVPVGYLLIGSVSATLIEKIKGKTLRFIGYFIFVFILAGRSVQANSMSSQAKAPDYQAQIDLRAAALNFKKTLPENSIILVNWQAVDKSDLYVKYWSGYEAFEIYYFHPAWDWLNLLDGRKNIYLLSDHVQPQYAKVIPEGSGFLYQLR